MASNSFAEAAQARTRRESLDANRLDGADLELPVGIARKLAERHERTAPDFALLYQQDAYWFRRLAHRLPGWTESPAHLLGDRLNALAVKAPTREVLDDLRASIEAQHFVWASTAYLVGVELGRCIERRYHPRKALALCGRCGGDLHEAPRLAFANENS